MLGEAALGRVEDDVFLVHAAGSRDQWLRAKLFQKPQEGLSVLDLQLDFRFARHADSHAAEAYFRPLWTSVSIANESIRAILSDSPALDVGSNLRTAGESFGYKRDL